MHSPLALSRFRPRLVDALAGYNRERFLKDVGAGATVGIVALPLAMAFAIASGLKPEAGIWTAIIAGFLISALGGSAVQIGGPAGAFIVIVYGIVERYGLPNLLISTACAGVLLFLMGLTGLGRLVRYVPVSIVVGFTNGIAVLILLSQLKDWLGLAIPRMPADVFSQIHTHGAAPRTASTPTPSGSALALPGRPVRVAEPAARRIALRPRGARRAGPHEPHARRALRLAHPGPDRGRRDAHAGGLGARAAGGDHRHPLRRHSAKACRPSRCPTSPGRRSSSW